MVERRLGDKLWMAWAAGFFDGEGSIGIAASHKGTPRRHGHHLVIQIGQNTREPLAQFAAVFGGNAWQRFHPPPRKPTWYWRAASSDATVVLKALLPYLVVKRRHAEKGIAFYDGRNKGKGGHTHFLSAEELRYRERYWLWFKKANHRGTLAD